MSVSRAGTDALLDEVSRLRAVEKEYLITRKVLAVLVERLLEHTGSAAITIADAAIADVPDLHAWRDPHRPVVIMATSRD